MCPFHFLKKCNIIQWYWRTHLPTRMSTMKWVILVIIFSLFISGHFSIKEDHTQDIYYEIEWNVLLSVNYNFKFHVCCCWTLSTFFAIWCFSNLWWQINNIYWSSLDVCCSRKVSLAVLFAISFPKLLYEGETISATVMFSIA